MGNCHANHDPLASKEVITQEDLIGKKIIGSSRKLVKKKLKTGLGIRMISLMK